MEPRLLPRLLIFGQHLSSQHIIPTLCLYQRPQHRKPPLPINAVKPVNLRRLTRILPKIQQRLRGRNRLVVLTGKRQRRRLIVDIVSVMAPPVQLVGLHPFLFILGRIAERLNSVFPPSGLRINMPRHVKRMRDVGHQLGIAFATRPSVLRKGRAFESMNDVMMHARMIGCVNQQLPQQIVRVHRTGPRIVIGQPKASHGMKRQEQLGIHLLRIFGDQRIQAINIALVSISPSRWKPARL